MPGRHGARTRVDLRTVEEGRARRRRDLVATEEPLEIRVLSRGESRPLALTMRTPGADFDLAAGFLLAEGLVAAPRDIVRLEACRGPGPADTDDNVVTVTLRPGLAVDWERYERHFGVHGGCGVCGKTRLDQLALAGHAPVVSDLRVPAELLYALPERLRADQAVFEATGGLHAAGLFDREGRLVALREDVGRHNALDKLFGWAFLEGRLPLREHIVLVSGRSSYEILQKCLAAGLPILCGVSAPSSLAVDLAERFGITLVGFLRKRRFNVYAGWERVELG